MAARLPDEIRPALDNGIPAVMVTCSAAGVPNTTIISQVYYVDETHMALSFQFFNKTIRNVRENPRAQRLRAGHSPVRRNWILEIEYDHSETEGPIFDAMDMQIEAIASATGMSGHLQAARGGHLSRPVRGEAAMTRPRMAAASV